MAKQTIFTGDVYTLNNGDVITVLDYINCREVLIKFPEGHCKTVRADEIRGGYIRNRLKPSRSSSKHFIGSVGQKNKPEDFEVVYSSWISMINRTTNNNTKSFAKSYIEATVEDSWLNFSNFYLWAINQIGYKNIGWQLDKDVLVKRNKHYGPETCIYLPRELNALLVGCNKSSSRGVYPIGVSYHKASGKYAAQGQVEGKRTWFGLYSNPIDAFLAYKIRKENEVHKTVEAWQGIIDQRAFNALINYTVDIND